MEVTMFERKVIYAWGDPSLDLTIKRLGMLAALTVDPKIKQAICQLHNHLYERWSPDMYKKFYYSNRMALEGGC